jgi:GNAT superfamily N-acetyltransferase
VLYAATVLITVGGMDIRPVRPHEHDELGELTVAAYAAIDAAAVDGAGYAAELRDVAGRVADAEVLVAVDDAGTVLGGVTYVPGPDSIWAEFSEPDGAGIRMLAVAPEAQGTGVGEALSRACVDRARAAGRGQILLHSTDRMATAHRLYERLGFTRDVSLDWEPNPGFWLRGFRFRLH